jgi:hypothetical protein
MAAGAAGAVAAAGPMVGPMVGPMWDGGDRGGDGGVGGGVVGVGVVVGGGVGGGVGGDGSGGGSIDIISSRGRWWHCSDRCLSSRSRSSHGAESWSPLAAGPIVGPMAGTMWDGGDDWSKARFFCINR